MKCSIKSLLALMVGAVMLESCNDSDFFETTKSGVAKTGNMSFTATVDGAESRASFSEDSPSFMKPNSEISVFSSGQNNKFTKNDEGIFTGNCEDNDEYYAISPYCENNKVLLDGGTYNFVIDWNGAEQTLDLNENYAPMVARVQNVVEGAQNVPLAFKSVCSFIKLTTDYVCKSITVRSRGGEMLAARSLSIGYHENGELSFYNYANPSKTITLTGKDGGNIEAGTYYIPVKPGPLSEGVDITFTNIYNEKIYTKSFTDSETLVRCGAIDLGTINIKSEMVHLAGAGTEANPYLIHDYDQLCEMRDFVNNSTGGADCYKLADNIDGHGTEFQPIGTLKKPFFGTFDGNHKTIKNIKLGHVFDTMSMTYNRPFSFDHPLFNSETVYFYYNVSALFAFVKNATLKDVTIDNMEFVSQDVPLNKKQAGKQTYVVSPFVGASFSSEEDALRTYITGVTVEKKDYSSNNFIKANEQETVAYGGIVGGSYGRLHISECNNYSSVCNIQLDQTSYIGGILGVASSLEISLYERIVNIIKCRNYGTFNIGSKRYSGTSVGGILGGAYHDDIATQICSCVNFGSINTDSEQQVDYVGGIVGNLNTSSGIPYGRHSIINCINNGDLYGSLSTGGIIGNVYDVLPAYISYCISLGNKSCIVGQSKTDVKISDCFNDLQGYTIREYCEYMNIKTVKMRQDCPQYFSIWKVYSGSGNKIDLSF